MASSSSFTVQDLRRRASNPEQLRRAQQLHDDGKVLLMGAFQDTTRAIVRSATDNGETYTVTLTTDLTGTCACPAWAQSPDSFCKHMAAVAIGVLSQDSPVSLEQHLSPASFDPPVSISIERHPTKPIIELRVDTAPVSPVVKARSRGIVDRPIHDTLIAVIDFETTGLTAGVDRVVEVSVVRIEPGRAPYVALDTLVHPGRRVSATEIHGITDEDVKDAPRFADIAGDLARALADSVVSAYNVYFDIKFLDYEMATAGLTYQPPHLCLMYLRPMLGLGKRCSLGDACQAHSISNTAAHMAASDALAAAHLWEIYRQAMVYKKVQTFGDLARLKAYKFIQSFETDPLSTATAAGLPATGARKPRGDALPLISAPQRDALHEYWNALQAVLSDFAVTDEEIAYLTAKRQELQLSTASLRGLHGRVFADVMRQYIEDKTLDDQECQNLHVLHQCLGRLGWAPGNR